MTYLLDTNVVSELRKPKPHGAVLAWMKDVPEEALYISAVTLGEIQAGIEITREQDAAKASEIEVWLNHLSETYNVIDVNASIFRCWAQLMHRRADPRLEDALIGATALVFDLRVVTRNTAHFKHLGVDLINPFIAPSASPSE